MDYSNFFTVSSSDEEDDVVVSVNVPYDKALAVMRSQPHENQPISGTYELGHESGGDVIWTTSFFPVLLSSRLIERFRRDGFSGWSASRCALDQGASEYFFLHVLGRCGPIDGSLSVREEKTYPGGVFPIWRGLFFDLASWDGSDFFMSMDESLGFLFVTERVKSAMEALGVKNVRFTSVDQFERMTP
jgi:hypothetical protein